MEEKYREYCKMIDGMMLKLREDASEGFNGYSIEWEMNIVAREKLVELKQELFRILETGRG